MMDGIKSEVISHVKVGAILGIIAMVFGIMFSRLTKVNTVIGWVNVPNITSMQPIEIVTFVGCLILITIIMGYVAKIVVRTVR